MDIQPCIRGFWREGERVRRYLIASIFGLRSCFWTAWSGCDVPGHPSARRTQAGFYARIYLHRPPPEDRDAALALLDETAAARRA